MKRIQISAAPGDPSTIWVSDSGKQYRTKKEALADKGNQNELVDTQLERRNHHRKRRCRTRCSNLGTYSL